MEPGILEMEPAGNGVVLRRSRPALAKLSVRVADATGVAKIAKSVTSNVLPVMAAEGIDLAGKKLGCGATTEAVLWSVCLCYDVDVLCRRTLWLAMGKGLLTGGHVHGLNARA